MPEGISSDAGYVCIYNLQAIRKRGELYSGGRLCQACPAQQYFLPLILGHAHDGQPDLNKQQ